MVMFLIAFAVSFGSAGALYSYLGNPFASTPPQLLTHKVQRGTLNLSVMQRGTLESAFNKDVTCRVKSGKTGATYIKWVIEDGAQVKQGQKLVELDSSALEDERRAQQIVVDQAFAAMVQAEEEHRIVVNQNQSDIETAKVAIQLAALDLEKYTGLPRDSVEKMTLEELAKLDLHTRTPEKGEYRQLLDDVNGRLKLAESDLNMWTERAAWSDRMVKKGYLTPSQAQSERSRLDSAREAFKKVQMESEVLQVFMKRRNETDLKSKLMEAIRALERTLAQAKAKEVKAESDYQTKKSIYQQERFKLADINAQIAECTIYAPQSGLVVYYVSEQSRFGGGTQTMIAQGEPVKEGQKLMRIPDLEHMLVNMRVHESAVMNIRGDVWKPTGFSDALTNVQTALSLSPFCPMSLLSATPFHTITLENNQDTFRDQDQVKLAAGQKATIRVDAFPKQSLNGHVKNVATVATQDFMTPDVKMFQTLVAIDDSLPGIKPGMSAEVVVQIEEPIQNTLLLPVPAVIGDHQMGRTRKCYVIVNGQPVMRDIEIGRNNDTLVEVVSGLNEGDEVVLNPSKMVEDGTKTRDNARPAAAPAAGGGKDWKGAPGGGDPSKRGGPPGGGAGGMPKGAPGAGGNRPDMGK